MADETDVQQQVEQPLSNKKHRQVTGARLGKKRYEVEWLLRDGVSKLEIARRLQISAHCVRAVARQMGAEEYAPPSGTSGNLPAVTAPASASLPDALREKAKLILEGVTTEKIQKASLSSLALSTDRLLNRAESIEQRGSNMAAFGEIWDKYGLTSSHAVSRVTLQQKVTIEAQGSRRREEEG